MGRFTALVRNQDYRPDIDGLRAIAVLAVVAFHYGMPISGGFVGVDIFFVISGFLITKQIVERLDAGTFTISGFYARRIKRIMPMALVVIASVVAAGYFLLSPGDYKSTSLGAAYSTVGAANLFFNWNTGYFDQAAELQPLLHYWSLGIEEQFYLAWPFACVLAWHFFRKNGLLIVALVVTAFSFWLSLRTTQLDPKAAFYLPLPRAWELGVGALVALSPTTPPHRSRMIHGIQIAGIGTILVSLFLISANASFPGAWPLLPCLGTAALLVGNEKTLTGNILAKWPLRSIGLISYSLYLWHWPIFVLFRHYNYQQSPTAVETTVLLGVSLILSILTWRFIEWPAKRSTIPTFRLFGASAATVATTAAAFFVIYKSDGLPRRLPDSLQAVSSAEKMWAWDCPQQITLEGLPYTYCAFGSPWQSAKHRAVLWGDSHAEQLAPFLAPVAQTSGVSVVVYRGCPPNVDGVQYMRDIPDRDNWNVACKNYQSRMLKYLEGRQIESVILAAAWSPTISHLYTSDNASPTGPERAAIMQDGLTQLLRKIKDVKHITIVADVPIRSVLPAECEMEKSGRIYRRECTTGMSRLPMSQYRNNQDIELSTLKDVAARDARVSLITLPDALCDDAACSDKINGEIVYMDKNHLRRNLSPTTMQMFAKASGLNNIFRQPD